MDQEKILYQVEDRVICKPGFTSKDRGSSENGGGGGYFPGKSFVISKITIGHNTNKVILWPEGEHLGVYQDTVELADEQQVRENIIHQINIELNSNETK